MNRTLPLLTALLLTPLSDLHADASLSLTQHLHSVADLGELHDIMAGAMPTTPPTTSCADARKTNVTWAQSGLNFHSTAMLIDDRPPTQQLRQWFAELVKSDYTP